MDKSYGIVRVGGGNSFGFLIMVWCCGGGSCLCNGIWCPVLYLGGSMPFLDRERGFMGMGRFGVLNVGLFCFSGCVRD